MPYKQNVRKNNFTDNYDYQLIQPNIPGRANIQAEVVDEKVQNWSYARLFSDALHTYYRLFALFASFWDGFHTENQRSGVKTVTIL